MKKKILLAVLMLVMLVFVLAISASAVEIDGIFYSLTDGEDGANGTATLTNENVNCTGETVEGRPNVVIIPEEVTYNNKTYTVTAINESAFAGQGWPGTSVVKEIYIPKTVTSIGTHCFRNCKELKKVEILGSDEAFTNAEFYGCSSLEEVDLSKMTRLDSVGEHCFSGCTKLTTIKFPNCLERIGGGKNFVLNCSSLKEIIIPDSVTKITDYSFQGAYNLTKIKLSANLVELGCNNFQSSQATSVVIPAAVESVGKHTFHGSKISTVVFASTKVDITKGTSATQMFEGASSLKIVFYPAKTEAEAKAFASQFILIKDWTNYVSYTDYLASPNATYTNTIVYGTENCSGCYDLSTKSTDTFLFEDYMSPMYDAKVCSTCQSTTKGIEYAPMFSGYMISTPEDGRAAVCVTYSVNSQSIAKYEEEMQTTISYGVIAVAKANLGENAPLDENGNVATLNKGVVIKAPISKGYSSYDFRITGAESLTEAVDVIIATYVTEGKGYVYLQNGVVENLSFASITIQPNA